MRHIRAEELPDLVPVQYGSAGVPHDLILRYRLWPDAERFLTMPQSAVWTISTSVLALREMLPGTEPSHLSLRVASPTLPTTNRSALTSLARRNSACTGSPGIGRASIFFAPAALARSRASRRIAY